VLAVRARNGDDVAVRLGQARQLGAAGACRLEQRRAALAQLQRQHRVVDILHSGRSAGRGGVRGGGVAQERAAPGGSAAARARTWLVAP